MPLLFYVSAVKEWGGCQFWRSSAEEAAGGGRTVQSSPLSIHLYPGPCSQDQRTAQTAKKLKQKHFHKDWKRYEYFKLNEKCCQEEKKQEMRNETLHALWWFLFPSDNCGKWCVLWPVPYYNKRCHAPVVSQKWGKWLHRLNFVLIWYCSLLITE